MTGRFSSLSRRRLLLGLGAAALAPRFAVALDRGVDAADHGLMPGTDDDQSARLELALHDAASRDTPLFLPPGRYRIGAVRLPSGARLHGIAGATRLVTHGPQPALSADGARMVAVSDVDVEGAAGRPSDDALLAFRDVDRLVLSRVGVRDGGSGVRLERCGGRIAGCRIEAIAGAGIFCLDGTDVAIENNDLSDCGDNAILVWQSDKREDGSRVVGNRIAGVRADSGGSGQNGNGVNVYRAGSVLVADNRITDCAFSAVRCNAADNATISRNRCARLDEVALYVEFGFQGAVVEANLIDGAAHGISVTNFDDGGRLAVVSGNLVRNVAAPERGVGISAEADTAVTGNVVENASRAGLVLGWGAFLRDVAATGNVVRDCPVGIGVSVAEGAGGAVVSGNTVAGATAGAIVGMDYDTVAVDDLLARADAFPQLVLSGNRVS